MARHKLEIYLFEIAQTKKAFAETVGIDPGHLHSILRGRRRPSVKLARKIEEATDGKVTKEELLFPEDFGYLPT